MRRYVVLSTAADGTQLVWGQLDGNGWTNRKRAGLLSSRLVEEGLEARVLPLLRADE